MRGDQRIHIHVPIVATADDHIAGTLRDHPFETFPIGDRHALIRQTLLAEHAHEPLGLAGFGCDDEQYRFMT